jgi:broad specificity phosphatase PhoE
MVKGLHSDAALALAQKESIEHMYGMSELQETMKCRPLLLRARILDLNEQKQQQQGNSKQGTEKSTTKIIHFVRHGQGFHNLLADIMSSQGYSWQQFSHSTENPYVRPEILDAPLTEIGRQQALAIQSRIRLCDTIPPPDCIFLSPMCRTLQTGIFAFEQYLGTTVPFVAHELLREETGVHICDKRRSKSRQEVEFPQVDFSLIETEDDALFQEEMRESKMQLGDRIYRFFEWLSQRPETCVAIVSHSGWLLTLFNGVCNRVDDESLKDWWQTGEMRSVVIEFSMSATGPVMES